MNVLRSLKYGYLAYFSKPVSDRLLVRTVHKLKPRRIVQLGIGLGERTRRMFEIALWHHAPESMRFVGIDLFEARNGGTPGMPLKQAHAMLKPSGIKVQLVPGDPLSALMRTANTIPGNDLLLVSADQDQDSLTQAWFFVPRILHPQSLVLLETANGWQILQSADIERLASASPRAQRRAA